MRLSSLLLLLLLSALAAPLPTTAQPAPWTEPQEPFQIADGLYYVGSAGLAALLFTSDEGHVLLDAPLEDNVTLVLANIRALGFDPADIRVHIASHAHFDHVGGLAALARATGGEVLISEPDAPSVRAGDDFGLDTDGYPPVVPTRLLRHLDTVRVGDVALTAHLTPGHTPGCTSWSGTVELGGEALDFVVACSLSVLPDYRIVGPDPTYPGQGADYCRALERLDALTPDIFLAAHAEFFEMQEKLQARRAGDPRAFVEDDLYRSWLAEAREGVERALAAQGHTGGCAALTG
jgi:metallo-beta-lactamase class B